MAIAQFDDTEHVGTVLTGIWDLLFLVHGPFV